MTNNQAQKIKQVQLVLKTLEDIITDHIQDEGEDLPAIELVKSALEMYENFLQDGE